MSDESAKFVLGVFLLIVLLAAGFIVVGFLVSFLYDMFMIGWNAYDVFADWWVE